MMLPVYFIYVNIIRKIMNRIEFTKLRVLFIYLYELTGANGSCN